MISLDLGLYLMIWITLIRLIWSGESYPWCHRIMVMKTYLLLQSVELQSRKKSIGN
jgi:hypothetical protein